MRGVDHAAGRDDDGQFAAGHHGRPLQHIGADAPSAPVGKRITVVETLPGSKGASRSM